MENISSCPISDLSRDSSRRPTAWLRRPTSEANQVSMQLGDRQTENRELMVDPGSWEKIVGQADLGVPELDVECESDADESLRRNLPARIGFCCGQREEIDLLFSRECFANDTKAFEKSVRVALEMTTGRICIKTSSSLHSLHSPVFGPPWETLNGPSQEESSRSAYRNILLHPNRLASIKSRIIRVPSEFFLRFAALDCSQKRAEQIPALFGTARPQFWLIYRQSSSFFWSNGFFSLFVCEKKNSFKGISLLTSRTNFKPVREIKSNPFEATKRVHCDLPLRNALALRPNQTQCDATTVPFKWTQLQIDDANRLEISRTKLRPRPQANTNFAAWNWPQMNANYRLIELFSLILRESLGAVRRAQLETSV